MKKTLLTGLVSLLSVLGFAQVECNIANIQAGFAGGFLDWELGQGGLYTFIDPADDYGIAQSCGATYPYTIETVNFSIASGAAFGLGDGIGTFQYLIGIYAVSADNPCNEPGALLASSGAITLELDGATLTPQSIEFNIDVNDGFFVSYEPISWSGPATQVPSVLWDNVARPLCVQVMTQDNGETWIDFTDFFTGGETGWADFTIFGTSESGSGGECETGILTNAMTESLCPDESTEIASVIPVTFPPGGNRGLLLTPGLDGTGGLDDEFILTGTTFPYNVNSGLNGVLEANMLPELSGTWDISIAVYSNTGDPLGTICSQSDIKTVVFLDETDPNCDGGTEPGDECTDWVNPSSTGGWTDFTTTFGGAPCNDGDGCPFNEITTFEVWESEAYAMENIQEGGEYTFSHCNGPGAGSWMPEYTIIAPSGAIDAFGAGDGDGCSITWTASEDGTYLIVINEAGACGVAGNTDNGFPAITCNGVPLCDTVEPGDECTDWVNPSSTGGWTDFTTTFGGAPCNDGDGCPFNEITAFEVWESEAYAMENIQEGGVYTFSHCNGPGAGSWIPEYTIIAPSGVVDAFGAGDGDGCSITWTATEDGTYLIVINEAGACGVAGNTDNGFPAITCNGLPLCDTVEPGDECTDWVNPSSTTGWTDFTGEFGGAPTPDGNGICETFTINAFEVWQSEAYAMENIQEGVSYTFSHCEGPGAGSWIPDYTIIAPSGAIDAFGAGDGDGCSITWTATEDGTYLIVINQAGACGVAGSTDNGFPSITCGGTSSITEASVNEFSVFPNPNNGQFVIEYIGENFLANIDVINISGKVIHSKQMMMNTNSRLDIDLGSAVSGMFFVRVTMNDNVQVIKVVVQ